jgi:putative membrane protein
MMGGLGLWWLVPLFWIAFIALVTWAVVTLVRGLGGSRTATITTSESRSALDILKSRYASGEISKREFEAKRKTLLK